jgi:hypothetical protein
MTAIGIMYEAINFWSSRFIFIYMIFGFDFDGAFHCFSSSFMPLLFCSSHEMKLDWEWDREDWGKG